MMHRRTFGMPFVAVAVMLALLAGGRLSIGRAQDADEKEAADRLSRYPTDAGLEDHAIADAPFQMAASSGKDFLLLSHCGANGTSAVFSGVTTWDLCFDAVSRYGLIIRLAGFRKSPTAPLMRVLFDARISEIFVPYHAGSPRFFDVSDFNFPLLTLTAADCPRPRLIIGGGKVCREFRDRGLAWKNDGLVRRGLELVLWAVIDAANYNYVIEWAFRDDGSIAGRAGSTGPKLGGPDDTSGHIHNFTWRLDVDLNGAGGDSVHLTRHAENFLVNPSTSADAESLIAVEGGRIWSPTTFNTLEIHDSLLQNGRGRPTAYELVPLRTGTARHTELYTRNDFWVTAFSSTELLAKLLPSYVNGQNVGSADIVMWYTSSAHHENGMRDEDRDTVPLLWTGFELVPQNLFDRTPFHR